jgi:hypothetical protein
LSSGRRSLRLLRPYPWVPGITWRCKGEMVRKIFDVLPARPEGLPAEDAS